MVLLSAYLTHHLISSLMSRSCAVDQRAKIRDRMINLKVATMLTYVAHKMCAITAHVPTHRLVARLIPRFQIACNTLFLLGGRDHAQRCVQIVLLCATIVMDPALTHVDCGTVGVDESPVWLCMVATATTAALSTKAASASRPCLLRITCAHGGCEYVRSIPC